MCMSDLYTQSEGNEQVAHNGKHNQELILFELEATDWLPSSTKTTGNEPR